MQVSLIYLTLWKLAKILKWSKFDTYLLYATSFSVIFFGLSINIHDHICNSLNILLFSYIIYTILINVNKVDAW